VSSSGLLKWCVGVTLFLSITWKIAIRPDNQNDLKEALVEFLEGNHFNVVMSEEVVNGTLIIKANTGSCRLEIARLTPDGSNRDLIRGLTEEKENLYVVFGGQVYAKQPILWTVLSYIWSRSLREVGLVRHITPILAVAANASCNIEQLPWQELGS
jgi:hypothetical protein